MGLTRRVAQAMHSQQSQRGARGAGKEAKVSRGQQQFRQWRRYAEEELGIEQLLLSAELKTNAGRLFLDRYGQLTDLTASGQIALRVLFDQHLKRVEWDHDEFPIRLYPFVQDQTLETDRAIAIDAGIAFGRPIVRRIGVNTSVIADRLDAGETIADVASDYEMTESELASAVMYERARAAPRFPSSRPRLCAPFRR